MWEPQPLTTLRASKACRGENFKLPALLTVTEKNLDILSNNLHDFSIRFIFKRVGGCGDMSVSNSDEFSKNC
jgi:hypothetical protein